MKKVMMTIAVVVVLMGISEKAQAQAGPWTNWAFGRSSYGGHRGYGGYLGGRSSWTNWAFGRSSYGLYGGYGGYGYGRDKTLGRVLGYSGLALGAFQVIDQSSIDNRLVDHQISVDNRVVSMNEKEQTFRHGQHRIIGARSNTVLRTTVPVRRIIKIKPEKTQKNQNQKIQQLHQQIEALKIQLAKLQQELEKQAKKK